MSMQCLLQWKAIHPYLRERFMVAQCRCTVCTRAVSSTEYCEAEKTIPTQETNISFLLSTAASNLKRSDTSGDFLPYVLVARWHRPIRLNAFVADFVPYEDGL